MVNASSKTNPDTFTTALTKVCLETHTISDQYMCSKRSTVPDPVQLCAGFKQVLGLRQTTQQLFAVFTAPLARKEQSSLSLQERQFGNFPSPSASSRTLLLPPHLACVYHPSHHIYSVPSPTNFQQHQMDSSGSFS